MLVEDESNGRRPSTVGGLGSYENLDRVRLSPLKLGRFCASFSSDQCFIKSLIISAGVWLRQHVLSCALLSHVHRLSANPPAPATFPAPVSLPAVWRAAPKPHKLLQSPTNCPVSRRDQVCRSCCCNCHAHFPLPPQDHGFKDGGIETALLFVQEPFLLKTRPLSRRQLRKACEEIGAGLRSAG